MSQNNQQSTSKGKQKSVTNKGDDFFIENKASQT